MSHDVRILSVPQKKHIRVVRLSGEIDGTNLEELKKALRQVINDPSLQVLILELNSLVFINSVVIQYFAELYEHFHRKNHKLLLSACNSHIFDILDLVGFTALVEHFPTTAEAVKSLEI